MKITPLLFVFGLILIISGDLYSQEKKLSIFRNQGNLAGYIDGAIAGKPKLAWRKQLPAAVSAVPVAAGSRILVCCTDEKVYCLEKAKGDVLWEYELGSESQAPVTVYNDTVIVCTTDSEVMSLGLADGKLNWSKKIGGKVAGAANIYAGKTGVQIITGCYDHMLYSFDLENGEILWQAEADNYINSSVSIQGDIGSVGSCDGYLYVVDLADGKVVGKFDSGAYIPGWPVNDGVSCYFGNYTGEFYSVNIKSCQKEWGFTAEDENIMKGPACSGGEVVFVDESGKLYCLNKVDGKEKWVFKVDNKTLTSPVIKGKSVFCCSENGWVYKLGLDDGKVEWKYLIGESMTLGVYMSDDGLLLPDDSGRVYSFSF